MWTREAGLRAALLFAALPACGCGSYGGGDVTAPPPPGSTITATADLSFTPASLTVDAGQAVTFAFKSVAHNVFFTSQAGAPDDIEGNNANVSLARTFATAGTYEYTCHIHPSMRGTVVVR